MSFYKIKNRIITYYKDCIVILISVSVAWVLLYRIVDPPLTLLMLTRMATGQGALKYDYVSEYRISSFIKVCAMASEDQNLPFHSGLDIEAIGKAIDSNKKGRKVFGASTITQQVAKNVFLFPQRSYIRKALELYFTLWIETLWPKDKILEMYLNVAEMGNLIFGVEAAAKSYYNKTADQLSLKESAAIISILPNPLKYNIRSPGPYVADRQGDIVSLFYSLGGTQYLRELYIKSEKSLYDFRKYKK